MSMTSREKTARAAAKAAVRAFVAVPLPPLDSDASVSALKVKLGEDDLTDVPQLAFESGDDDEKGNAFSNEGEVDEEAYANY